MDILMNKHYIRLNEKSELVLGFSDAFIEPEETDILIASDAGRHFELDGQVNPPMTDDNGAPLYKWVSDELIETTTEERATYITKPPITENVKIWDVLTYLVNN